MHAGASYFCSTFLNGMAIWENENWDAWMDELASRDFIVIDQFLPAEMYARMRSFLVKKLREDEFEKAGLGSLFNNQVDTRIRGDYTYWLDKKRDEHLSAFFELVEELNLQLNRACFLSLGGYEFHLAWYPPGTFYQKHVDRFKDRSNRMISVVIYMNEAWKDGDGGELKIYRPDEEILVEPLANRCILFKSDVTEHEVMTTNAGRYSLTGWLLHKPSTVGYLFGNGI